MGGSRTEVGDVEDEFEKCVGGGQAGEGAGGCSRREGEDGGREDDSSGGGWGSDVKGRTNEQQKEVKEDGSVYVRVSLDEGEKKQIKK